MLVLCAAELVSRQSQQALLQSECDLLRRRNMELQSDAERHSAVHAKTLAELDAARAAEQRSAAQLDESERRYREASLEVTRLRGGIDVQTLERRRVQHESDVSQARFAELLKEVETLQVRRDLCCRTVSWHRCRRA